MRRFLMIAAVAMAAALAAAPVSAQVRIQPYIVPVIRIPIIKLIPPSVALSRAMSMAPQAQALGVRLKGPLYIVKLKQGNQVIQLRVDAATGAVAQ